MANIGMALTETNVVTLATKLLDGSEEGSKIEEFKKKRS
jgi:hypothetical protein